MTELIEETTEKVATKPSLRKALERGMPRFKTKDGFNVLALSREIDTTTEAIYKWFRENHLPPKRAKELVALSDGKLTLDTLSKFF